MGLSLRTKNALTVLVAVVVVGAFIFLAEGSKKDKDDRLEAIENLTTTTVRRTTTTRQPTTTTSTSVVTTTSTSTAAVSATTAVPRTTTTRRATTATTARPTTTVAPGPSGPSREASSNEATIIHNSDGTAATAASAAGPTRPFGFTVKSCFPVNGSCPTERSGISGDGVPVRFTVTVKNNTNRTISFGDDGLTIDITLQNPNGTTTQFVMDAKSEKTLKPGEGLAISSTTTVVGIGSFKWTAACDIDYGT